MSLTTFFSAYCWLAISCLAVITYSLFATGTDIESFCRNRKAPLWIGYVVIIGCVLLWPLFLLFMLTNFPRK